MVNRLGLARARRATGSVASTALLMAASCAWVACGSADTVASQRAGSHGGAAGAVDANAANASSAANGADGGGGTGPDATASNALSSAARIEIFDPIFPTVPAGPGSAPYASDGDVYIATTLAENGAAITSLIRGGYEYVLNEPPDYPNHIRGASFQATFFFDSPLDASGTYRTYYNDCNNPLETGGVADTTTSNGGLTSPTNLMSPRAGVLQSAAQLAYYVDPAGPTDWWEPTNTAVSGTSPTCLVGKINNPKFSSHNNAATSSVFLGKTMTIGNVGTEAVPLRIPGVVAIDMVMATSKPYSFSALYPAFAAYPHNADPGSLSQKKRYDPRSKSLVDSAETYAKNPVVAFSPNHAHALAVYTPQIALQGEGTDTQNGYLHVGFNGMDTLMPSLRVANLPAGTYKFKSYYVVGTLEQVTGALDALHGAFKVLDPRVFDWSYYVTNNGLGGMLEDQARLHWLTTGLAEGRQAIASFSIKSHLAASPALAAKFGTSYYAALLDYLQ